MGNRRNSTASRLKNPGPSIGNRPRLPNWAGAGAEKFEGSNQFAVSIPCWTVIGPLTLGELLVSVPGAFNGPVLVVKFSGAPVIRLRTPEIPQPPASQAPAPFWR